MFKYPKLIPTTIVSIEQRCYACKNWFKFPTPLVRKMEKECVKIKAGESVPFLKVICEHCGKSTTAVTPGKYDKPDLPKAKCLVQFVVTKPSASPVAPATKKVAAKEASELVNDIRMQMDAVRQNVRSFSHKFPAWAERVNIADGLLTCGIAALHPVVKDMEKVESNKKRR